MNSIKIPIRKRTQDDGEKPFWISFSDLMTALMVLFLVATTTTLMTATKAVSAAEGRHQSKINDIKKLFDGIREAAKPFPEIRVNENEYTIDFGDAAYFDTDSNRLNKRQEQFLRDFVPIILRSARSTLGRRWIKQVIVDGFADPRGTYIHNLNLSMQRSERVLCVLLAPGLNKQPTLNDEDKTTIRKLFLVGGSSFNSLRPKLEESRRIELRLEFLGEDDNGNQTHEIPRLDNDPRCPLDKA